MGNWLVTIKGTVTKNIPVMADNEDQAEELAQEMFNLDDDNTQESYTQHTVEIKDLEGTAKIKMSDIPGGKEDDE